MAKDKKWGISEERDLAMAVILSQQGDKAKYDWPKIHEHMSNWGYSFTRDAMSQHWTKRIMKDFKERHGENATKAATSGTSDDAPRTPTPRKTPRTGARGAKAKGEENVKDESDEEETKSKPKKRKRGLEAEGHSITVKTDEDERQRRERSMTVRVDEGSFATSASEQ